MSLHVCRSFTVFEINYGNYAAVGEAVAFVLGILV